MPSPNALSSTRWSVRRPDAPRWSSPTVSAPCALRTALSSSTAGKSLRKAPTKSYWLERADTPIFISFRFLGRGPVSSLLLRKVENYDDLTIPMHSHSPGDRIFHGNGSSEHRNREGSRRWTRRHGRAGCQCCADQGRGRAALHHDNRRGRWICTQKCSCGRVHAECKRFPASRKRKWLSPWVRRHFGPSA